MRRRKKVMKVGNVLVKSVEQIEGIRESGKINTAVLDYVEAHIQAGISTEEIDRWVYEETVRMGAKPAPLNYEGFPKSVCTSRNNVICHGMFIERIIFFERHGFSICQKFHGNQKQTDFNSGLLHSVSQIKL